MNRAKLAANWIINGLSEKLTERKLKFEDNPLSIDDFNDFLDLIEYDIISSKGAKELWEHMWNEGGKPSDLLFKYNLFQNNNSSELEGIIDKLMLENPDKVAAAKEKPAARGWFIGQVMAATNKSADPKLLNEILTKRLS